MNNLILLVDKRKDEIKLQTDTTAHIITKLQKNLSLSTTMKFKCKKFLENHNKSDMPSYQCHMNDE